MKTLTLSLLSILTFNTLATDVQEQFFENFKHHCGKTYVGKTVFPDDPGHAFAGKQLVMHVSSCSDSKISIPFKVGDDTSRTWLLTKTDKGLLFKHDHRHPDGTPDEISMYGGYADDKGTAFSMSFPADDATYKLVPEGLTNIWRISFDMKNKQFVYYLERHSKPRYKAVFEIN
ncbi:MAG: hypothetical protein L3J52_07915 [Proteobacteria bacterium]|nr:hypothetical protein [Pseudomonadota bacterium]